MLIKSCRSPSILGGCIILIPSSGNSSSPPTAVKMVRTESYAAVLAVVASFHTAAGAEIDMIHVASSQEYLSGKVHARSMAAKTVSLTLEVCFTASAADMR